MPRTFAIVCGLVGALYWLVTIGAGYNVKDQLRSDGMQWILFFFATPVFLVLNLPALVLCFTRFHRTAAIVAAAALCAYALPFADFLFIR